MDIAFILSAFTKLDIGQKPASARSMTDCSGRTLRRGASSDVARGSLENCTMLSQPSGAAKLTTEVVACIFLYGQKAQPMSFFSRTATNFAIHSSEFSPDSPSQIGT